MMNYNILEAIIEFENNELSRVIVLVEISAGDVRAIYATNQPMNGYTMLLPGMQVSNDVLQLVAGFGRETDARDKIFWNWKAKRAGNKTKKMMPPEGGTI